MFFECLKKIMIPFYCTSMELQSCSSNVMTTTINMLPCSIDWWILRRFFFIYSVSSFQVIRIIQLIKYLMSFSLGTNYVPYQIELSGGINQKLLVLSWVDIIIVRFVSLSLYLKLITVPCVTIFFISNQNQMFQCVTLNSYSRLHPITVW